MSNAKLLKTIDWFINVPEDFFGDRTKTMIISSIFIVEFNNVKTKWRIFINFNHKNERNVYVFLLRCADLSQIDFDCGIHFSIVNSRIIKQMEIPKSKWVDQNESRNNNYMGCKMTNLEVLKERYEEICNDGKLLLRIKFSAINLNISDDVNDFSTILTSSWHRKLDLGIFVVENESKPEDVIFEMITSLAESDITINTDDGMTHKAHRFVLGEKSTVFKSMFTIDMEEAANKSVDIIEFKGPVMKELIRFIYFGKVHKIDQINVELFKAAKVYEIANLPELCLKSIIDVRVTHKNVIEVVELAHVYEINQLFHHCCDKLQVLRPHKSIQMALQNLNEKLQLKIMTSIVNNLTKSEVHIVVDTCELGG